jgi:hypothetical protein
MTGSFPTDTHSSSLLCSGCGESLTDSGDWHTPLQKLKTRTDKHRDKPKWKANVVECSRSRRASITRN